MIEQSYAIPAIHFVVKLSDRLFAERRKVISEKWNIQNANS